MIIKELNVKSFRNYKHQQIVFDKDVNIIYGDNAQGKTNILEAIFVSATSKSQRTRNDKELILFEQDNAHIKANIEKNDRDFVIDVHIKKNGSKGVAVNKFAIGKASELFDIIDIVFFSPEDLNIIKNGPLDRRKWLDYKLASISKQYYNYLLNYNKVLKNRNVVLHDIFFDKSAEETLNVWDMQLLSYGSKVIKLRSDFIDRLNEIIEPIHSDISGKKDELIIKYIKNTSIDEFEKKLNLSLERDKKTGFTNVGPHRDDMMFLLNHKDARQFASQGQQKSIIVSLKLSEIDLIYEKKKDMPILLLDDVLSELDSNRQNYLLNCIKNIQTIITCTGIDDFVKMRYNINKLFYVENGMITEKN